MKFLQRRELPMSNVFISYRRDDSKYQADRLYKALTQILSPDRVFMDIDSIKPGQDFIEILEGWVQRCDILLALIGSGWVNALDPKTGKRRLDSPNDFVRIEVREALKRSIPVVPVLLDGASIPEADQLPDDLKMLVRRNAQFVDFRTFDADVARLIKRLALGDRPKGRLPPRNEVSGRSSKPAAGKRRAKAKDVVKSGTSHSKAQIRANEGGTPKAPTNVVNLLDALRNMVAAEASSVKAPAPKAGFHLQHSGKSDTFKDLDAAPEMVVVPAGAFLMGSKDDEGEDDETTA